MFDRVLNKYESPEIRQFNDDKAIFRLNPNNKRFNFFT